jgi:hypothetical protein
VIIKEVRGITQWYNQVLEDRESRKGLEETEKMEEDLKTFHPLT